MKKRIQALFLAAVAMGFLVAPSHDANAASLAQFLTNRGLGGAINTIGQAFNSAVNIANQVSPLAGGIVGAAANLVFGILFYDPIPAPPPPQN